MAFQRTSDSSSDSDWLTTPLLQSRPLRRSAEDLFRGRMAPTTEKVWSGCRWTVVYDRCPPKAVVGPCIYAGLRGGSEALSRSKTNICQIG